MKTLIITNYWVPWNAAGTFRWYELTRHMNNYDILTSRRPRRGHYDTSLIHNSETSRSVLKQPNVYRFGWKLPAILWGFLALFHIPKGYDLYVFTSPPESLFFTAWVQQLFGRRVLVDVRDAIDRHKQRHRWLTFFLIFFYRRLKNVVVCWKFLDPSKPVVNPGYLIFNTAGNIRPPQMLYEGRVNYYSYYELLANGWVRSYKGKPLNYGCSSYPQIKQLGYDVDHWMRAEVKKVRPKHWGDLAEEMRAIMENAIK